MEESSTYQYILEEGKAEGRLQAARRILLLVSSKRLGEPDVATQAAISATASLERLEYLVERAMEVETWQELLA